MSNQIIFLIIFGSAFICYAVERKIAWIAHVSAVCLLILFAMLLSQIGIVPTQSELYDFFQGPLVLLAITMMTLDFRLKDMIKIPLNIIIIFIAGIIGSIVGGLISGLVASKILGIDAYKLAAQLTASYIGGLENAVAMQKIFDIPNNYFVAAFAIDNIVTSLWIVITIWLANDKGSEIQIAENEASNFDEVRVSIVSIIACLFVSLGIVLLSEYVSKYIGFLHKILWIPIFALIAGQIPMFKEYFKSAYVLGAILFSGFFFSVGAISDLKEILKLPNIIIIMPFIVVFTHAVFIIISAKILKMSRTSTLVVSQVLIGGPGTAVAVAQAKKWKSGISVGIILGVFGYSIANYFGVFVFNLLQFIMTM